MSREGESHHLTCLTLRSQKLPVAGRGGCLRQSRRRKLRSNRHKFLPFWGFHRRPFGETGEIRPSLRSRPAFGSTGKGERGQGWPKATAGGGAKRSEAALTE